MSPFFLSLLPLGLLLLLVLVAKRPLWISSIIVLLFTVALSAWSFDLRIERWLEGVSRGAWNGARIGLILLSALLYSGTVKASGSLASLGKWIQSIAPEKHQQALLVAWCFCGLIESSSGFGTPALLMAPVLLALGFTKTESATLTFLGTCVAVPFGAMGIPLVLGFQGFPLAPVLGFLVPFQFVFAVVIPFWLCYRAERALGGFALAVVLGLFSGLLMMGFRSLGPELCGVVTYLIVTSASVASALFWSGRSAKPRASVPWKAIFPFWSLALLLVAGRLLCRQLGWPFNPAFPIFLVSFIAWGTSAYPPKERRRLIGSSLVSSARPIVALFCFCWIAEIAQLSRLGEALASPFHRPEYPALAPVLGAIGAFFTGTSTVSNLLLGKLQASLALDRGLPLAYGLALQAIGSAVGVLASLPSLLGVSTVLRLQHGERALLARNLPIVFILLAWVGGLAVFLKP